MGDKHTKKLEELLQDWFYETARRNGIVFSIVVSRNAEGELFTQAIGVNKVALEMAKSLESRMMEGVGIKIEDIPAEESRN